MTKKTEISQEDWQKLIDFHERLNPVLFRTIALLQAVSYTANDVDTAKDAAKLYNELEPLAKYIFIEDAPFGIKQIE